MSYDHEARKRGKKISKHTSRPFSGVYVHHDVRMDDKGVFSVRYLQIWYSAPTLKELTQKVDEAVAEQGAPEWSYFIEVDPVDFEEDLEDRGYHRWRNGRDKIRLISDWRVVKLTNVLLPPDGSSTNYSGGKVHPYRLRKNATVAEDGSLEDEPDDEIRTTDVEPSEGTVLVPWTPERWRALDEIAAAARELGRRLQGALGGAPEVVSGFLDDHVASRLQRMALPPLPEPAPAGGKIARSKRSAR